MSEREELEVIGRQGFGNGEQPIDVRRHFEALRRSRYVIVALVLTITGAALVASLLLPSTYRATATIVREDDAGLFAARDADSVERELATIQGLIQTRSVLEEAADDLGETPESLEGKITASVDPDANIIRISATDGDADGAAAIANTVARTFLSQRQDAEESRIDRARASLQSELTQLEGEPNSQEAIQAVRDRLSSLSVAEAAIGSDLRLAQEADPPSAPHSPRPVRNTLLAFFASLLLATLFALVRDQLTPRVGGPRDLSRMLDLPVLSGIPYVRRRLRRGTALTPGEHEAFQALQATIRFQLPDQQHIILITSGVEREGKTTVTANLGRALARAGHKTLLLSADLRRPRLHELFENTTSGAVGLAGLLSGLSKGDTRMIKQAVETAGGARGNLHIIPSGARMPDPGRLFLGGAIETLFEYIRKMDYRYVLIDAPPLLGIADSQVMARHADHMLLVARLDRLTVETVADTRDLLDRIGVTPLGLVVIGIRRSISYYYANAPVLEEA